MISTRVDKSIVTRNAQLVYKALNGVFAIYKPPNVPVNALKQTIASNLCEDLNQLEVRPPNDHVQIVGDTTDKLQVVVHPSYADHVNLVGPRYMKEDMKLVGANVLPKEASGVVLLSLKDGNEQAIKMRLNRPMKIFKVTGKLGIATMTGFDSSKIMEQTTYKHVRRIALDKLCASIQSSHQKTMFQCLGVSPSSQTAYEILKEGPTRIADNKIPMIYSIKCTNFSPPYFDLEIVCINETATYLKTLIDEMGIRLKSSATITKLQCLQYGLFNIQIALLSKHWRVQHILENMELCRKIIDKNPFLLDQKSPHLVQGTGIK